MRQERLNSIEVSCCSLPLDETINRANYVKNEQICPEDSPDTGVEEGGCENEIEEQANTSTSEYAQKDSKYYSDLAAWVPPDTSSREASKIVRAFTRLLERGEAPCVDSLAKMTSLPVEEVRTYLESAPWLRKDDSSPDGTVKYLPIEPSGARFRTGVDNSCAADEAEVIGELGGD